MVEDNIGTVKQRTAIRELASNYDTSHGLQGALEDFYDMRWRTYGNFLRFSCLEPAKEDPSKKGQVPRDLIDVLEHLGKKGVVETVVTEKEDLSYELVRESFNDVEISLSKKIVNYTFGPGAFFSGLLCSVYAGSTAILAKGGTIEPTEFPITIFSLGVAGLLSGIMTLPKHFRDYRLAYEAVPKEIKNREKAFWELHHIAKEYNA